MRVVEGLAILTFFVLLGAAIFMLISFYICDGMNCKAFNEAAVVGAPGSAAYSQTLLRETFNDGIWPIPYIGAAILTPLALWFMGYPITILTFAILFFVSFVVIYFMFSFFGHHYIRPITTYVYDYIGNNCPGTATVTTIFNNIQDNDNIVDNLENLGNIEDNDICMSEYGI